MEKKKERVKEKRKKRERGKQLKEERMRVTGREREGLQLPINGVIEEDKNRGISSISSLLSFSLSFILSSLSL